MLETTTSYEQPFQSDLLLSRPGTSILVGASFSGKTTTLKNIIDDIGGYFDLYFVFSLNKETLDDWGSYIRKRDKAVIKIEAIDNILNIPRISNKLIKIRDKKRQLRMCLILDDILGDESGATTKEFKYKKNLNHFIAYSARHYNIWSFLLVQDVCSLGRAIYSNAMAVFVFYERNQMIFEQHIIPKILDCVSNRELPAGQRKACLKVKMEQLNPYQSLVVFVNRDTQRSELYVI